MKKQKAFSLVELLVAVAVFTLVTITVVFFAIDAIRASRNARQELAVTMRLQSLGNALLQQKQDVWANIVASTDAGPRHFALVDNKYVVQVGEETLADGTRLKFEVKPAYRDALGNLVSEANGTYDVHTRQVDLTATWTDFLGTPHSRVISVFLNDWNTESWYQTTESDFNAGTVYQTYITNVSGGESQLETFYYNDWCKPLLALSSFDLPGQGQAKAVTATPGFAFVGTGDNSSGYSMAKIGIQDTDPVQATVLGTFDGYKVNAIFGEPDYGYIATDTNDREIVIVQLSSQPYTEVGRFNASGTTDANSVYVVGNRGYMTQGSTLRIFDLSSKTGARSQLGSRSLAGTGDKIIVRGNYAFVGIAGAAVELEIFNISNPANITRVATGDVNTSFTTDMHVREDGNRVYIGTASNSGREFFILDSTTKSGTIPIIGSYETTGMSIEGIGVIDNRAILVGTGGKEYQVAKLDNETAPSKCGEMDINSGATAVATVTEVSGNVYSYVISQEASGEFKVIKGGKGGGGPTGEGYLESGEYTSRVFDTNMANVNYLYLTWKASVPTGTTLQAQVRSSTSAAMTGATWMGPDGTDASYFDDPFSALTPAVLDNKRYVQVKFYYTSDTVSTPILEEWALNYE